MACRGTLSLLTPDSSMPVTAGVAYRIRPAANDGIDVVDIRGAAPIVAALSEAGAMPEPAPAMADVDPVESFVPASPEPAPARLPPPREVAPAPARADGPSFDCRRVTSEVLEAVCANPALAALDSEMSGLFYDLRDGADRETRAALDETRDIFIARRQSCRDEDCVARVYRERIGELEEFR